ncbi:MAG: hypothetical protein ACOC0V_04650 [Oceanicaulis sp.]
MPHDPFIQGRRLGRDGELLIVIDDFHPDPQALIEPACARAFRPIGKY